MSDQLAHFSFTVPLPFNPHEHDLPTHTHTQGTPKTHNASGNEL